MIQSMNNLSFLELEFRTVIKPETSWWIEIFLGIESLLSMERMFSPCPPLCIVMLLLDFTELTVEIVCVSSRLSSHVVQPIITDSTITPIFTQTLQGRPASYRTAPHHTISSHSLSARASSSWSNVSST